MEPQVSPVLTFELDYTHQPDVGTPFSSVLCVSVCALWWVFIHLPVVFVRIFEAVMQTCMGKVCRGLAYLATQGFGCFYLGLLSRRTEFMDLQPAFNW